MRQVKIQTVNGSPAIVIDGKVFPPMAMTIATKDIVNDRQILDTDYFRKLGESGIRIFFPITDTEWGRPGALAEFEQVCRFILSAVPDAYFIVRIGLHPPAAWVDEHPEECFTYNDGFCPAVTLANEAYHPQFSHHYSLSSAKWRARAGQALVETCRKHRELSFADRIVGYFFAAGGTSEWYYNLDTQTDTIFGDFSEAFRRAFSGYLTDKYGTDECLRKAWRDDSTSLENPRLYGLTERYFADQMERDYRTGAVPECGVTTAGAYDYLLKGCNVGAFLDVDKCLGLADFYKAFHKTVADSQIYFGRIVKDLYDGNILTGSFYGAYGWTKFAGGCTSASVLHILDSGAIDFLSAPGDYANRQPGGFTGQREMQDSFRLRNRIFVVEEDTRTHVEPPYYRTLAGCFDMDDSINCLKRDFGRNLSEDLFAWWFDQIKGGGRYRFDAIYDLFARQQKVAKYAYRHDRHKGNEIALIYDEESVCSVSNETTTACTQYFRDYEVGRLGAGVDYYFHNDLARNDMPDYKLYVFFNTFELTADERAAIRKKLAKNHATAVWVYASGLIDPLADKRLDISHIENLTGFRVGRLDEVSEIKFRLLTHPLTAGVDERAVYGYEREESHNNIVHGAGRPVSFAFPLFYPNDAAATVLGVNCINGLPMLAVKEHNGFRSVWHASKIVNADILRMIARWAGCHLWSDDGDVVYASQHFVTIHATKRGRKTLRLPKPSSPYEIYERKRYGENVTEFTVAMQTGETKTFCLTAESDF